MMAPSYPDLKHKRVNEKRKKKVSLTPCTRKKKLVVYDGSVVPRFSPEAHTRAHI